MKKNWLLILSLFFSLTVWGQTQTETERVQQERQIQRDQHRQRDNEGIREGAKQKQIEFSKQIGIKFSTPEERHKAEERIKNLERERADFLTELKEKNHVPNEYFVKYSSLIDSKQANLARIFPEIYCENGKTVNVQELERCSDRPQIPGAGSLYSFRLFELPKYLLIDSIKDYISQSDIHFVDNKLIVGNKLTQSIIAEIGDVSLESVTTKSSAVTFLRKWKRVKNKGQLDEQNLILANGIEKDGYIFSNSVEVKKDTTYILRSVAYSEKINSFWNTDRIDAFRVVGQKSDGSIIILWKNLTKRSCDSYVTNCPALTLAKQKK